MSQSKLPLRQQESPEKLWSDVDENNREALWSGWLPGCLLVLLPSSTLQLKTVSGWSEGFPNSWLMFFIYNLIIDINTLWIYVWFLTWEITWTSSLNSSACLAIRSGCDNWSFHSNCGWPSGGQNPHNQPQKGAGLVSQLSGLSQTFVVFLTLHYLQAFSLDCQWVTDVVIHGFYTSSSSLRFHLEGLAFFPT